MTRKVYEQQKESFADAKQKLKLAFNSIIQINKEERNPQNHQDKRADFSVAFAHYTTQAATYRRYVYDTRKLAKLEKSDQKLENVRKRIDSWFLFNKEYPEGLLWDELFPDDVFCTPAEVPSGSVPVFVGGDTETQTRSEDFVSIHSKDSMVDTDQTQQQTANGSVITPVQSSTTTAADVSGVSVESSTSKNMNSGTATQGDVSGNTNEDEVSDSGTVVKNQSKKPSDAEPPSQ